MFVEAGLPNVNQVLNNADSVFARVKVLYHLAAFLDDFWMLVGLEDDLEQIFLVHPLPELGSGAKNLTVFIRVDEFAVDQFVEIF